MIQLEEIERFCRGVTHNLLGDDRCLTIPEACFNHDISAWVADPESKSFAHFAWLAPSLVGFTIDQQQYDYREENFKHFARDDLGRGKALIRISPRTLWRVPNCVDKHSSISELVEHEQTPDFFEIPKPVRSCA